MKVPFVIIQNDKYQGSIYFRIVFLENYIYGDVLLLVNVNINPSKSLDVWHNFATFKQNVSHSRIICHQNIWKPG